MDTVLKCFVEQSKEILKDNLVGIYLHGSAVMGCYNPAKSDIDLIIVVKDSIEDSVKRVFMDMVVELNEKGPAKGIEMSVVKQSACKPFVYPTPFELHFSVAHLDWYGKNLDDYVSKMKGEDKDLAAHFTIINHRGKCLYGASIKDIFADVPVQDYIDSIWNDIAEAEEEITDNPMYIILNLARVLAYIKDGLVLSKKEGGEWALNNVHEIYHSLIQDALIEYAEDRIISYDTNLARDYAKYMVKAIESRNFDYIAHPDLYMVKYRNWTDSCIEAAHMICKAAEKCNVPLEVNANGIRKTLARHPEWNRYMYPYKEFWEIAAQYNIRTIIGSDTHNYEEMEDLPMEMARIFAKELGLNIIESIF